MKQRTVPLIKTKSNAHSIQVNSGWTGGVIGVDIYRIFILTSALLGDNLLYVTNNICFISLNSANILDILKEYSDIVQFDNKFSSRNFIWLANYLFNNYLVGEDVPNEWRTAYISFVYKKGKIASSVNYILGSWSIE